MQGGREGSGETWRGGFLSKGSREELMVTWARMVAVGNEIYLGGKVNISTRPDDILDVDFCFYQLGGWQSHLLG